MNNKIASIYLISDKSKINREARVFISQPDPTKESLAGKLFVIAEISASRDEAAKIADFIISDIHYNYYQDEKIFLREKIETLKVESIFESVLVRSNKNLLEFLNSERIKIQPRDISITIGIIHNNRVHFSNVGENQAFLLYRKDNQGEYKLINVERNENEDEDKATFKKLFSSIISGDIPPRSYFIIANESLAEYIYNQELLESITKLPPSGAAEHIKNQLAALNARVPFLGIIIKNCFNENCEVEDSEDRPYHQPALPVNGDNCNVLSTERNTEKILSAAGNGLSAGNIKDAIGQGLNKINPLPPVMDLVKKMKTNQDVAINPAAGNLVQEKSRFSFKNLNRTSKILLIILGIGLASLLGSIAFSKTKQYRQEVKKNTEDWKTSIEQKENQIDSYLLYDNESGAKDVLKEIEVLMAAVSEKNRSSDDYKKLQDKFQEQSDKLQHLIKVRDLKTVVNLADVYGQINADNIKFSKDKDANRLYVADSAAGTIYKINLKTNLHKTIKVDSGKLLYPAFVDGMLLYLGDNKITSLNTKNDSASSTPISISEEDKIIGVDSFKGKIYLLSPAKNQIFRYTLGAKGYEKKEARLKDKADLSQVSAFSVNQKDSAVYFLKKDAQIMKFYDGKAQEFSLEALEPAMSNADKLIMESNIYILDSSAKRLAVFGADGKFLWQYQADAVNQLRDFAIDETNKKIYLLDGSTIYEVDMVK